MSGIKLTTNFNLSAKIPLDERVSVYDLLSIISPYEGLLVYQTKDGLYYKYVNGTFIDINKGFNEAISTINNTTIPAIISDLDDTNIKLDTKVTKVVGKALSTNNYDNIAKAKLGAISENAKKVEESVTNGNVLIDDVETNVYDDTGLIEETNTKLDTKVDKITGKGLSANDFNNTYKTKVDGISTGSNKVIDSTTNGNVLIDNVEVNVYDDKDLKEEVDTKVDKVSGKQLSVNDFNNTYKSKIDGISANAKKVEVSTTNGNIKIDNTETKVYNDASLITKIDTKVDKVTGKNLSTNDFDNNYKTKIEGISVNAKKVVVSTTNGNIKIDDIETKVYDDTVLTLNVSILKSPMVDFIATVDNTSVISFSGVSGLDLNTACFQIFYRGVLLDGTNFLINSKNSILLLDWSLKKGEVIKLKYFTKS